LTGDLFTFFMTADGGKKMSAIILKTEGICKDFGALRAVSDLSISIEEGALHCIIGPNGAGKTTLFNLLTKDLPPTSGRIYYNNEDITALEPYEVSRLGIGRSYQITSVFQQQSVFDNVWIAVYQHEGSGAFNFWNRSGRFKDLEASAFEYLKLVGLEDHADRPASELSYGDQRLLEIAVTLATSPKLLLFDEPANGLSEEETRKVAELIRDLVPKYTVIMIEHKIDVVMEISDRISVMNFGELIFEGDPEAVRNNEEVKKAYFGV